MGCRSAAAGRGRGGPAADRAQVGDRPHGGDDRQELVERIEEYRRGLVPLVVPLTLFQHHLRRYPVEWITEQTYLAPYPAELMLRNHV
ncbi:MAG: DUF1722 domain-containing protein [Planctomycetota bacterium]